jgi:recombination protein RecR
MNSIHKLTELFAKFPGIGPRQAKRFVYYLLTRNPGYIDEFTRLVEQLKNDVQECSSCHRFFEKDASKSELCPICRNSARDNSMLIIVSRDIDLENIEKSHSYNGLYFVLGGAVPILEKAPESRIRQKELIKTIEERGSKGDLKEIILAMNLTPEGENTGDYIIQLLHSLTSKFAIKISHLGRGISTGTELEYSDSDTIANALKNRQ